MGTPASFQAASSRSPGAWIEELDIPNILPSFWIAGKRVVIGMAFAMPVNALWSDQAVRSSNAGSCGSKYAAETSGRKRRGTMPLAKHEYMIEEVRDEWHGPDHVFFKVRADDGGLYILRHETSVPDGEWELVSFRDRGE